MENQTADVILVQPRLTQSPWRKRLTGVGHFMKKKPLGATGLMIVVFFALLAVIGPLVAPHDPWEMSAQRILQSPDSGHPFGTDVMGRDILSRTIYGARISMFVGIVVMLFATAAGATIGVTCAYFGGKYDLIVQRFVDAKTAFPSLLLALALMAAFGSSLTSVIVALTIIMSSRGVRVIRAQAMSIKETPYIDASRSIGASNTRIMLLHVFPNTFGPTMIIATVTVGAVILLEASLSFLGVGMPISIISWGSMLSGEVLQHFAAAPWVGLFPGFALTLVVFGINVFGDALRDTFDPRLRGR